MTSGKACISRWHNPAGLETGRAGVWHPVPPRPHQHIFSETCWAARGDSSGSADSLPNAESARPLPAGLFPAAAASIACWLSHGVSWRFRCVFFARKTSDAAQGVVIAAIVILMLSPRLRGNSMDALFPPRSAEQRPAPPPRCFWGKEYSSDRRVWEASPQTRWDPVEGSVGRLRGGDVGERSGRGGLF